MRTLAVGAEPEVRALVERALLLRGHEVAALADAETAWQAWQREAFPLVVLVASGSFLPGKDGLELCARIRGAPRGDTSVILAIAGRETPQGLAAALDASADDYLCLEQPCALAALEARLAVAERHVARIAERKRIDAAPALQALHDALTGLPNRALLYDRLHQAILTARRNNAALALLVMDLDRFKEVNDALGHCAGDLLVQQVGQRLRGVLRASDTVARLGGDEFAVVLPGTNGEGATLAARKLLHALEELFVVEGQSLDVGMSIGIALYPLHGEDVETLLRRADIAMYLAKRGRGGYAVYTSEQDQHTPHRLALMGELRTAIEQEQLLLHYQPQVHFKSGQVVGLEALVRWQHPQRGLIPPDQFITLAERTGLIQPLSRWVLGQALRQCQAWRQAGLALPVAVNLSARNLHDPHLPGMIATLLATWGLPPPWPSVEITESAVMTNPHRAIEVLGRLQAMGVRISIDDFGTGYSSLAYLKRLPVDELKIDKTFVRTMAVDRKDLAIVRATIELAHSLGLSVVAEGVENQATLDHLAALGCDAAQGYYLSRPLPAPELVRWLAESPWGPKPQGSRNQKSQSTSNLT
ncbi:MAG: EAL domain-containing protein [Chloroflexi bacterium]|nr:EAL domain-containing protein [Chloroflexota bacterium]